MACFRCHNQRCVIAITWSIFAILSIFASPPAADILVYGVVGHWWSQTRDISNTLCINFIRFTGNNLFHVFFFWRSVTTKLKRFPRATRQIETVSSVLPDLMKQFPSCWSTNWISFSCTYYLTKWNSFPRATRRNETVTTALIVSMTNPRNQSWENRMSITWKWRRCSHISTSGVLASTIDVRWRPTDTNNKPSEMTSGVSCLPWLTCLVWLA